MKSGNDFMRDDSHCDVDRLGYLHLFIFISINNYLDPYIFKETQTKILNKNQAGLIFSIIHKTECSDMHSKDTTALKRR